MDRNSNPVYIGPGGWAILHMSAKRADATSDLRPFVWLVDTYRQGFPCGDCRKHFDEFCTINPPPTIPVRDGQNQDAFRWSWRAHNNANILTGKALLDYETANKWWSQGGCSSGCSMESSHGPKDTGPKDTGPELSYRIVSRDHKY